MQIFKYDPEKTHILSTEANSGIQYAVNLINARQYQQALNVLKQVAALDPKGSLTYIRMAYVYTALNDPASAEKSLLKAIEIYPGYRDAILSLANLYKAQNKIPEAKNVIGKFLESNPNDTTALRIVSGLGEIKQDSLKLK